MKDKVLSSLASVRAKAFAIPMMFGLGLLGVTYAQSAPPASLITLSDTEETALFDIYTQVLAWLKAFVVEFNLVIAIVIATIIILGFMSRFTRRKRV